MMTSVEGKPNPDLPGTLDRTDNTGKKTLKSGDPRKYYHKPTVDTNAVQTLFNLSDNNTMTSVEGKPNPDLPGTLDRKDNTGKKTLKSGDPRKYYHKPTVDTNAVQTLFNLSDNNTMTSVEGKPNPDLPGTLDRTDNTGKKTLKSGDPRKYYHKPTVDTNAVQTLFNLSVNNTMTSVEGKPNPDLPGTLDRTDNTGKKTLKSGDPRKYYHKTTVDTNAVQTLFNLSVNNTMTSVEGKPNPDLPGTLDRTDNTGKKTLKSGDPRKYYRELAVDKNTVNKGLALSEDKKITRVEEKQRYPDHPDRFDQYTPQLLCGHGMTGRCYWEVKWSVGASIAVSYKGISRKGGSYDCVFGFNDKSWRLLCSNAGYSVIHNKIGTAMSYSSFSATDRIGVYVDHPAGTLSFYKVSSDSLTPIYTYNTTFTEPLYAGFGFGSPGGSVQLVPASG